MFDGNILLVLYSKVKFREYQKFLPYPGTYGQPPRHKSITQKEVELMNIKRICVAIIFVLLCTMLLVGCQTEAAPVPTATPQPAAPAELEVEEGEKLNAGDHAFDPDGKIFSYGQFSLENNTPVHN
jgi:hypothetical protein